MDQYSCIRCKYCRKTMRIFGIGNCRFAPAIILPRPGFAYSFYQDSNNSRARLICPIFFFLLKKINLLGVLMKMLMKGCSFSDGYKLRVTCVVKFCHNKNKYPIPETQITFMSISAFTKDIFFYDDKNFYNVSTSRSQTSGHQ